jgi:hypothetical protein
MREPAAINAMQYRGFLIHYGAYEREDYENGWSGVYRVFQGKTKIWESNLNIDGGFHSSPIAEQSALFLAKAYVDAQMERNR